MIRRRRPTREIPFSFDSFLDVVANVVGIIIRLILLTWIGGKSYTGFVLPAASTPTAAPLVAETVVLPEPEDPLAPELERQKQEMAVAQALFLEQFRALEQLQGTERKLTEEELNALARQVSALNEERTQLESAAANTAKTGQGALLSLTEIQERGKRLVAELEALRQAPSPKKTYRYRTPVSHPLQTEEVMFEMKKGRVTVIDIAAMEDEVQRTLRDKGEQLKTRWRVTDVTAPVGAFRLRYTIEREHGLLEKDDVPPVSGNFHYGQTGWELEPLHAERGETIEEALAKGSAFHKVIDALDPNQTAATFCVYPDSFSEYRRLRDYLHDHDITVAGRPQPEGSAITAGRDGTASRGQ